MSLQQFADSIYWPWLKSNREASTVYNYQRSYECHIKAELGHERLWSIRTAMVSRALANIFRKNAHLTKASLDMYKAIVYSMMKLAISQGYAPAPNPAGRDCLVPNSQNKGRETLHYDLDVILQMISVLQGQAKVAVAIAGLAGLSQSEIMGLQAWDYNGRQISVRRKVWEGKVGKTKTKARQASVPVIETLKEILDEYLVEQGEIKPDRWLFVNQHGNPKQLSVLYEDHIKDQIAVENIPWLGWHAFRRGIATNLKRLAARGVSLDS
jgi:integrase